jgi:hypothetical protein
MKHPTVKWSVAAVVAVVLAVPGVVLYAKWPGVETSQLNIVLVLPLLALALYWLHRWLPLRLQWVVAWLLLPLGGVAYLMWPNDQSWQYGALSAIPLIALAAIPQERRTEERGEEQEPAYGGLADGPWGPP